jgi:predicted lipid-binding transport protein (Tim44 family)
MPYASIQAAAEYAGILARGLSQGFRHAWRFTRDFAIDNFYVILALGLLIIVLMMLASPRIRGGRS